MEIGDLMKSENALYQAPGCTLPSRNGVRAPNWIRSPIETSELDSRWLENWMQVRAAICQAIKQESSTCFETIPNGLTRS